MFNLVQIQERLKGVPEEALKYYANGGSREVPPFIALGELNRRKKMQEEAAASEAAEMEGAPTIKEQIEQQTGLMALQGARMQQAAQQQASQVASAITPAPNTMETRPAQLRASGGLAEISSGIPKASGMNPDMLKKLMILMALKSKGGLDKLPMKQGMFSRDDYAKGGIVAFAGENGSFVETSPGFYELDEKKKDKEEEGLSPQERMVMDIIRQRKERPTLDQRREEAGLPSVAPDTTAKTREDLARREQELKESDTLINRILALKPGRFGSGETAASVVAYEQQRANKMDEIKKLKAAAEDQRVAAEAAFKEGRFKEGEADMANADRFDLDAANKLSQLVSERKYREGSLDVQRGNLTLQRERNLLDKGDRDRMRQMAEINDYITSYRAKNAGSTKYFNKPDLLEQDAIMAAMRFFGPERFKNLGLAPNMGATPEVGTVMQGYKFKGGNPADKNNWEKV